MEQWKSIPKFEGSLVSAEGRVKSLPRAGTKGGILKSSVCSGRYLRVCLGRTCKLVHVLVAEAFVPNPLNLPEVNHLGPKSDCRAIMLEWRTRLGNARHAVMSGLKGDGVSFVQNRWVARYYPEPGKRAYLGRYITKEEAVKVRQEAISRLPNVI